MPAFLKVYSIMVWIVELVYLTACVLALFYVPKEKALEDSTVNIVVSLEVMLLIVYLHNRKNLLRELIEKLNSVLAADDETLRNVTIQTLKPLEKPLRIYTIACASTVVIWTSLPFIKIFKKNEFYYVDFRLPIALSREPFSAGVFIGGIILEFFGSLYMILRKVSLDLYTMHLILLMTAQYRYLRVKFQTVLQSEDRRLKNLNNDAVWRNIFHESEKSFKREVGLVTHHHGIVIEMAVILKKIFAPNIGILYINNVFRFCFLSFMIATNSAVQFEKVLVLSYTFGALVQLYVLCFCIQQLLEASTTVMADAFHEKWYIYDTSIHRAVAIMTLANKLECRLSSFRNIDLTLPSFMSILNQAYSVCLLFLKAKRV